MRARTFVACSASVAGRACALEQRRTGARAVAATHHVAAIHCTQHAHRRSPAQPRAAARPSAQRRTNQGTPQCQCSPHSLPANRRARHHCCWRRWGCTSSLPSASRTGRGCCTPAPPACRPPLLVAAQRQRDATQREGVQAIAPFVTVTDTTPSDEAGRWTARSSGSAPGVCVKFTVAAPPAPGWHRLPASVTFTPGTSGSACAARVSLRAAGQRRPGGAGAPAARWPRRRPPRRGEWQACSGRGSRA